MALETDAMGDDKKDQRIPVMMSADEVAVIDEWRRKHPDLPSRSEAIRQLVDLGIANAMNAGITSKRK
jgi:hypothetical protein